MIFKDSMTLQVSIQPFISKGSRNVSQIDPGGKVITDCSMASDNILLAAS